MFMFDATCIQRFPVGIIHDCYTLIVFFFYAFRFKTKAAVFQATQFIVKVFINRSRIDYRLRNSFIFLASLIIIDASPNFDAFKERVDQYIIAANRNALITVIEIVVVKRMFMI